MLCLRDHLRPDFWELAHKEGHEKAKAKDLKEQIRLLEGLNADAKKAGHPQPIPEEKLASLREEQYEVARKL